MNESMEKAVADLERSMKGMQRAIGEKLTPAVQDLARELGGLSKRLRTPTRLERLGQWLSRCPAVPWRRTSSAEGGVVHDHGPVTACIVAVGLWIVEREQ